VSAVHPQLLLNMLAHFACTVCLSATGQPHARRVSLQLTQIKNCKIHSALQETLLSGSSNSTAMLACLVTALHSKCPCRSPSCKQQRASRDRGAAGAGPWLHSGPTGLQKPWRSSAGGQLILQESCERPCRWPAVNSGRKSSP
jgi:hypothetical protein